MTTTAREYQREHNHNFMGKNMRTNEVFRFGFLEDKTVTSTTQQQAHGIQVGSAVRVIETVNKIIFKEQDLLNLGTIGYCRVAQVETKILDGDVLDFIPYANADVITRLTLVSVGAN